MTILANVRECFDYCIADIKHDFLPNESRRVYYPFHPETLGKGQPLNGLIESAKPAYAKLQSIAYAIQNKKLIRGTTCLYSDAKAINELVNSKKHDSVIRVAEHRRSKSRIEFPNGAVMNVSPMYPMGEDGAPDFSKPNISSLENWTASPGVKIYPVKDFFFVSSSVGMSRRDVHGFCMTAITAARFIIGDVYNAAYGIDANTFLEKS